MTSRQALRWSFLQQAGRVVPGYIGLVVLSRILSPDDFGTVGIAGLWLGMLNAFVGAGFGPAIVQRANVPRSDLSALAAITVVIGALVAGVGYLVAAPLCHLLGVPEATHYAQVSSLAFVLAGFGIVPAAVMQRRLAFQRLAARDVTASLLSLIVGVSAALSGAGAWALVAQPLVQAGTASTMVWWSERNTLGLALPRWRVVRTYASYSTDVTLFQVIKAVIQTSYRVVIGGLLGTFALGLYMLAYKLAVETTAVARAGLGGFLFPFMAQRQEDQRALRAAFERSTAALLGLMSIGLVLLILAAPLVPFVFGREWEGAVSVIPFLAVVALADCVFGTSGELLKATGGTRALLLWSGTYAVTQVSALVIGAKVGGITGAAAGAAIGCILVLPLSFAQAADRLGAPGPALARAVLPAALLPFLGGFAWLLVRWFSPPSIWTGIMAVIIVTGLLALAVRDVHRHHQHLTRTGAA